MKLRYPYTVSFGDCGHSAVKIRLDYPGYEEYGELQDAWRTGRAVQICLPRREEREMTVTVYGYIRSLDLITSTLSGRRVEFELMICDPVDTVKGDKHNA